MVSLHRPLRNGQLYERCVTYAGTTVIGQQPNYETLYFTSCNVTVFSTSFFGYNTFCELQQKSLWNIKFLKSSAILQNASLFSIQIILTFSFSVYSDAFYYLSCFFEKGQYTKKYQFLINVIAVKARKNNNELTATYVFFIYISCL